MPFPVSVTAGWAARANINTTGSDVTGYFRYPEYPDMSLPACQWMGWEVTRPDHLQNLTTGSTKKFGYFFSRNERFKLFQHSFPCLLICMSTALLPPDNLEVPQNRSKARPEKPEKAKELPQLLLPAFAHRTARFFHLRDSGGTTGAIASPFPRARLCVEGNDSSDANARRTSPLLPRACLLVMKSWTVVSNSSIASRNAR
jgi:hypothetical protein